MRSLLSLFQGFAPSYIERFFQGIFERSNSLRRFRLVNVEFSNNRRDFNVLQVWKCLSLSVTWIIHYSGVSLPGRAQDPYIADMAKNWEIIRFRWELISEGNLGTISLISLVYSLLVTHRCPQCYRIMRSCSSVFLLPLEVLRNLLRFLTVTILLSKAQNYLRNIKGAAHFTPTFPDWWNLSNVFLMFYSSRYEPKFLYHFTSLRSPNLSWPSSLWLVVTSREFYKVEKKNCKFSLNGKSKILRIYCWQKTRDLSDQNSRFNLNGKSSSASSVMSQLDFWCKDRPAWHPCQLLVEM